MHSIQIDELVFLGQATASLRKRKFLGKYQSNNFFFFRGMTVLITLHDILGVHLRRNFTLLERSRRRAFEFLICLPFPQQCSSTVQRNAALGPQGWPGLTGLAGQQRPPPTELMPRWWPGDQAQRGGAWRLRPERGPAWTRPGTARPGPAMLGS